MVDSTLKGGNITVNVSDGTDSALLINNTRLAGDTNLTVTGETHSTGANYGIYALNNSSFSAGQKLALKAEATGGTNGAFNISNITLNATNAVLYATASGLMAWVSKSAVHLTILMITAKWRLNRSRFGIRIDHDLAYISDRGLASQSITIWHTSDH
ncbi:hypothetical protein ADU00_11655 [Salmonella enterica subsp. enterica]|nr:hypothetical protein [Salmonella enterica subsp. enterica serovar Hvittingfoss]